MAGLGAVAAIAIVSLSLSSAAHIPRFRPYLKHVPPLLASSLNSDLLGQCTEEWRDATLDHFNWGPNDLNKTTFRQRYFVCSSYWKPDEQGRPGPIFFYLGNEADVTLYLNNTGLMWESAPMFGALLVFAEHRYYGKSLPYGPKGVRDHMRYLSAEQAMADYAELIQELKEGLEAWEAPVIGFGGSYGGMLASWFRMKYPHVMDGAIAGSAPIWNFLGEEPPFDWGAFAKGVTYDTSEAAGSAPHCTDNVRSAWRVMRELGRSAEGRQAIKEATSLCADVDLADEDDVLQLRDWLSNAFDYMAMGNFPYPSGYILNGNGQLPAWPVRVACQSLAGGELADVQLLQGVAQAAGVFYNYTGQVQCFDPNAGVNPETDANADFWDYQYCTEMFMPFARDGVSDMFWSDPFSIDDAVAACKSKWGVTTRTGWATTEWGGKRIWAASNIVFSNGLMDPWHGGGVLQDVSDSVVAVMIPEGAHHLDLMFSHPDDPQSVKDARQLQRDHMAKWIREARARSSKPSSSSSSSGSSTGSGSSKWFVGGGLLQRLGLGALLGRRGAAGGVVAAAA